MADADLCGDKKKGRGLEVHGTRGLHWLELLSSIGSSFGAEMCHGSNQSMGIKKFGLMD